MNENLTPKPMMLDETKPSPERLREAYGLALRLWQLQPWDMPMGENQLLAVEHADGRRYVLSILGEFGEHRALVIYPDVAAYCQIAGIPSHDQLRLQDAFFSIHQKQIAFLKAAELLKGERAAIKASGVKFPRGVNPSLESFVPGYAPGMMGAGELAGTIDAVKVFLDFMSRHSAEDINIYRDQGDSVSTWRESPDGNWTLGEDTFLSASPVPVTLSQSLLDKVAALPVKKDFSLEVGAIPVPCDRTPSGRGVMPRFMIAADETTGFSIRTAFIPPPEGREFDWTPAVEFTLDVMVMLGFRPGRLAVLGGFLEAVMNSLCRSELKGTQMLMHAECDAVREVFDFVAQRMGF